MSAANTTLAYGSVAKTFHWLTALLILSVIPLGLIANDLAHQIQDPSFDGSQSVIDRAIFLFSLHKTIGVTVFFVALARIAWAFTQPKPGLLNADNKVEAFLADTVHWLLYGSLVLVPLSGWVHHAAAAGFAPIWWPFGQTLPFVPKSESLATTASALHLIFEKVLIASILLHVAGALKHHVVDKDATLRRMLPGRHDLPEPPKQVHSPVPFVAAVVLWGTAVAVGTGLGSFEPSYGTSRDTHVASSDTTSAPETAKTDDVRPDTWTVEAGTLGIEVKQLGSTVTGEFDAWTADITFTNPQDNGPAGHVSVVIDIASLTLGSVTAQAMGPDYFDSAAFPDAVFEADLQKRDTGYVAEGTLRIRDKTLPVSMPFTLALSGDTADMTATLEVNRLDFDIGLGVKDEASLGFGVLIKVDLAAKKTG